MRNRLPITAVAITLGLLLTACTPSDDPTPTSTSTSESPTPNPTETSTSEEPTTEPSAEDPQAVNIEAARQSLLDYIAAVNEVGTEGYTTWQEKLVMYWGTPEIANSLGAYYQTSADAGERSEGDAVVVSLEATEYIEDPSGAGKEQVRLEYCADNSAVTTYDAAGNPIAKTAPPRFTWSVLMQRQDVGPWTINERTPFVERIC